MAANSTINGNPRHVDPSQASIFISYRRDDTGEETMRVHRRLASEYGAHRVFMDVEDIALGVDHVKDVARQIARCSVVIVMIGKRWLSIAGPGGDRRLHQSDDPVRAEIAAALEESNLRVIPVLVQSASMPSVEDLPADIALVTQRNWIQLRSEHWEDDLKRLVEDLNRTMKGGQLLRQNP